MEARRKLLSLSTTLFFLVAVPGLASQGVAGQPAPEPRILAHFPHEHDILQPHSSLSFVFSQLMDGPSVNESLKVTDGLGVDVSLDLSGECGDATTLVFSPSSGRWLPGNYTMRFAKPIKSAAGTFSNASLGSVDFQVSSSAPIAIQAAVIDAAGRIFNVTSGVPTNLSAGNIDLELGFSVELDLGDFLDAFQGKPSTKTSECDGVSISVSLSISAGATVELRLNGTNVVDRSNRSNRLSGTFVIMLAGMQGPPPATTIDYGVAFAVSLLFNVVLALITAFVYWRKPRATKSGPGSPHAPSEALEEPNTDSTERSDEEEVL